jgi:hypothetical protein
MAITITAQGNEPLPTGEYRVELTAIELSTGQYGDQLRWTFHVLDKGRNLVAYSSLSPEPCEQVYALGSGFAGTPHPSRGAGGLRRAYRQNRHRHRRAQAQRRWLGIQRD